MEDVRSGYASRSRVGAISSTTLLGQVMFLVAVAIGFLALGSVIGPGEERAGLGQIFFFVGFGMLIVTWFVRPLRFGALGIGWLYAVALCFGLGLAPLMNNLVNTDSADVITQAAGSTALIVVGMGTVGFMLSKDLARWMRPLTYVVLGLVAVSFVMLIVGSGGNPILSIAIGAVSAALILVDFNYIRKHGTEDDAVWLATGIFVSILNIFLSALNLFR